MIVLSESGVALSIGCLVSEIGTRIHPLIVRGVAVTTEIRPLILKMQLRLRLGKRTTIPA